MNARIFVYSTIIVVGIYCFHKAYIRFQLSKAKHPSLRGHAKISRRVAKLLRFYHYDESRFFNSDNAPDNIARSRKRGLENLILSAQSTSPKTIAFSASLEDCISDVHFTANYRVPFPYRNHLPRSLKLGSIATQTSGQKIKDLDGNWRYDLSGSYGVNVFGYDFYKSCMKEGIAKVDDLGPVLGPYHPVIKENVEELKSISGLDEVSFHMSGTEAVMQAVRLARYHTGKTHLVRFCGAYHGWWDGVQPGVGNQRKANDVYTLADLSDHTLHVLNTRNDIACVLINPMQAMHPNSDAPSDATLLNSERRTHVSREGYTVWLKKIEQVCTSKGIVLIFDEVFTGFRLGYRGAQEYFGVQADMVTYGKTLGGGLPIGAVCGRAYLMKRFKDDSPANVSFARGTFNSHPYVMGAMNMFLQRIKSNKIQTTYANQEAIWNHRVANLNNALIAQQLPVRIANLHSVISISYTTPSRYNWMFQFYLRNEGLELSWIGTGRMIMSFAFTDQEFEEISHRIIDAAKKMEADGWWWQHPELSNKWIKRQMAKDMFNAHFPALATFTTSPTPFKKLTNRNGKLSAVVPKSTSNIRQKGLINHD